MTNSSNSGFTYRWFETQGIADRWSTLPYIKSVRQYLEIGSFEGMSACWMIENSDVESLVCIDTWSGGEEHINSGIDMSDVERRFDFNVTRAGEGVDREIFLTKLKGESLDKLSELVVQTPPVLFDFVYVDGSHRPADVLADAVLGFRLLKVGGFMIFDDYTWYDQTTNDGIRSSPKLAIDAFSSCFFDRIKFLNNPVMQVGFVKIQ